MSNANSIVSVTNFVTKKWVRVFNIMLLEHVNNSSIIWMNSQAGYSLILS